MDHRVHLTYRGRLEEDAADQLLDELRRLAPNMGPVLSFERREMPVGRELWSFVVTLALDADDAAGALVRAEAVADLAVKRVTGGVVRPVGAEVELVDERPAGVAA
jgi:hypothetical protein